MVLVVWVVVGGVRSDCGDSDSAGKNWWKLIVWEWFLSRVVEVFW